MPTRNISLTPELDRLVQRCLKTGRYESASEVVRQALRLLDEHQNEQAARVKALESALDAGEASGTFEGDPFAAAFKELGLTYDRE